MKHNCADILCNFFTLTFLFPSKLVRPENIRPNPFDWCSFVQDLPLILLKDLQNWKKGQKRPFLINSDHFLQNLAIPDVKLLMSQFHCFMWYKKCIPNLELKNFVKSFLLLFKYFLLKTNESPRLFHFLR